MGEELWYDEWKHEGRRNRKRVSVARVKRAEEQGRERDCVVIQSQTLKLPVAHLKEGKSR